MCWHVAHHEGVIDPQVVIAAIGAAVFLYTRGRVTPVADPKDGAGRPLVNAAAAGRNVVDAIKASEEASGTRPGGTTQGGTQR
jgi:hypothetical protein